MDPLVARPCFHCNGQDHGLIDCLLLAQSRSTHHRAPFPTLCRQTWSFRSFKYPLIPVVPVFDEHSQAIDLAQALEQYGVTVEKWGRGFCDFSTTIAEMIRNVTHMSPSFTHNEFGFCVDIQIENSVEAQEQLDNVIRRSHSDVMNYNTGYSGSLTSLLDHPSPVRPGEYVSGSTSFAQQSHVFPGVGGFNAQISEPTGDTGYSNPYINLQPENSAAKPESALNTTTTQSGNGGGLNAQTSGIAGGNSYSSPYIDPQPQKPATKRKSAQNPTTTQLGSGGQVQGSEITKSRKTSESATTRKRATPQKATAPSKNANNAAAVPNSRKATASTASRKRPAPKKAAAKGKDNEGARLGEMIHQDASGGYLAVQNPFSRGTDANAFAFTGGGFGVQYPFTGGATANAAAMNGGDFAFQLPMTGEGFAIQGSMTEGYFGVQGASTRGGFPIDNPYLEGGFAVQNASTRVAATSAIAAKDAEGRNADWLHDHDVDYHRIFPSQIGAYGAVHSQSGAYGAMVSGTVPMEAASTGAMVNTSAAMNDEDCSYELDDTICGIAPLGATAGGVVDHEGVSKEVTGEVITGGNQMA